MSGPKDRGKETRAALEAAFARQKELKVKIGQATNITDQTRKEFEERVGIELNFLDEETLLAFSSGAVDVEKDLASAIGGEGLFGRRQRRASAQKLALDRPGQRQTRGALLTGSRSAGGLLT